MTIDTLNIARRAVGALLVTVLSVVIVLGLSVHVAPLLNGEIVVIHGGSMQPTIPLGSFVAVQRVSADQLRPGDVVTIKTASGTLITHRVVSVDMLPDGPSLRLKGDANATPDAAPVPGSAVQGRVVLSVPIAGYVLAMMSSPAGLVSLLSMVASLLTFLWLLDEMIAMLDEDERASLPALGATTA